MENEDKMQKNIIDGIISYVKSHVGTVCIAFSVVAWFDHRYLDATDKLALKMDSYHEQFLAANSDIKIIEKDVEEIKKDIENLQATKSKSEPLKPDRSFPIIGMYAIPPKEDTISYKQEFITASL